MKQRGFFDEEDRLKEISRLGDPLERLNATIEWERFRPYLNRKRYHPPIFSSLKNPISCAAMEVCYEAAQYERTS
jgi:hypothetical protein